MTHSVRNTLLAGGATLAVAGAFLYSQSGRTKSRDDVTGASPYGHKTKITSAARPTHHLSAASAGVRQGLPEPARSPHSPGSVADSEWIAARIAAISDLAWFDDTSSLQKILSELRSPLPQIRAAALDATRAFGSRDAIPYLVNRAAETGDLVEQKALIDLIEHLKLPTVIEQLEEEIEK